jgi:hypothetical protein
MTRVANKVVRRRRSSRRNSSVRRRGSSVRQRSRRRRKSRSSRLRPTRMKRTRSVRRSRRKRSRGAGAASSRVRHSDPVIELNRACSATHVAWQKLLKIFDGLQSQQNELRQLQETIEHIDDKMVNASDSATAVKLRKRLQSLTKELQNNSREGAALYQTEDRVATQLRAAEKRLVALGHKDKIHSCRDDLIQFKPTKKVVSSSASPQIRHNALRLLQPKSTNQTMIWHPAGR